MSVEAKMIGLCMVFGALALLFLSPLLFLLWVEMRSRTESGKDEELTLREKNRPDLCNGSYDQYCGMTPRFNNITAVLEHYDQAELVADMNRYWVAS